MTDVKSPNLDNVRARMLSVFGGVDKYLSTQDFPVVLPETLMAKYVDDPAWQSNRFVSLKLDGVHAMLYANSDGAFVWRRNGGLAQLPQSPWANSLKGTKFEVFLDGELVETTAMAPCTLFFPFDCYLLPHTQPPFANMHKHQYEQRLQAISALLTDANFAPTATTNFKVLPKPFVRVGEMKDVLLAFAGRDSAGDMKPVVNDAQRRVLWTKHNVLCDGLIFASGNATIRFEKPGDLTKWKPVITFDLAARKSPDGDGAFLACVGRHYELYGGRMHSAAALQERMVYMCVPRGADAWDVIESLPGKKTPNARRTVDEMLRAVRGEQVTLTTLGNRLVLHKGKRKVVEEENDVVVDEVTAKRRRLRLPAPADPLQSVIDSFHHSYADVCRQLDEQFFSIWRGDPLAELEMRLVEPTNPSAAQWKSLVTFVDESTPHLFVYQKRRTTTLDEVFTRSDGGHVNDRGATVLRRRRAIDADWEEDKKTVEYTRKVPLTRTMHVVIGGGSRDSDGGVQYKFAISLKREEPFATEEEFNAERSKGWDKVTYRKMLRVAFVDAHEDRRFVVHLSDVRTSSSSAAALDDDKTAQLTHEAEIEGLNRFDCHAKTLMAAHTHIFSHLARTELERQPARLVVGGKGSAR